MELDALPRDAFAALPLPVTLGATPTVYGSRDGALQAIPIGRALACGATRWSSMSTEATEVQISPLADNRFTSTSLTISSTAVTGIATPLSVASTTSCP